MKRRVYARNAFRFVRLDTPTDEPSEPRRCRAASIALVGMAAAGSETKVRWNRPEEHRWRPLTGLALCAASLIVMVVMTVSIAGDLLGIAPGQGATGVKWIDRALEDEYYSRTLPVLIPGVITYVYFNWLSARFFEHT